MILAFQCPSFLCPIGRKSRPLVDDDFSIGLAFATDFSEAFSSSWIDFSDKFVNIVHNSNPRYGLQRNVELELQYCIVCHDCKLSRPRERRISHYHESTIFHVFILHLDASCILDMMSFSFRLDVTSMKKFCPISTNWITSGLLTSFQIFARVLAASFPVVMGLHFCERK